MITRILSRTAFYLILAIGLFYILFPFYWMIVNSLKPSAELFATPLSYWPRQLTLDNYRAVLADGSFVRSIFNSFVVAGGATILSLALSSMAAYALARYRFAGKQATLYIILGMSTFPQIAVLGGLFTLARALGIYNTYWALILSYMIFTLPFCVWVLTSFVKEIPDTLDEAATIDGASAWQILWKVIIPLAGPGLVATGLLSFINAWNEFLFALTLTADNQARTVPVAVALFSGQSEHELPWGKITAASTVVTVPVVLLALMFQKRIVEGLTSGAVKG
ncbi:trehalose/maltose transport system permease protein [Neorhizobium alkalisoli]|uniref:Trehalose/maltose transport system permease protein n=1 Tax=Neorhizobium alkalisoli TaxID=528178 RepID=A0A561R8J5_9HYPH|nr:trehalose/maltose transport system permease protein [Neorhizobium alkalisoli]